MSWQHYTCQLVHKFSLQAAEKHVCCRLATRAILFEENAFDLDSDTMQLAIAIVDRLAKEPKHLASEFRTLQARQKMVDHKGGACQGCSQGCSDCCGRDWQWKTETVSALFHHYSECNVLLSVSFLSCWLASTRC